MALPLPIDWAMGLTKKALTKSEQRHDEVSPERHPV
jgi:hypothetical protein